MTRVIKEEKICQNCNGKGRVRNKYGAKINCTACRGGKVTLEKTVED